METKLYEKHQLKILKCLSIYNIISHNTFNLVRLLQ